jgi:hypothetical protein
LSNETAKTSRCALKLLGVYAVLVTLLQHKKLQAFDSAYGMMERKEVINENTHYKTGCNLIPKNIQHSQTETLFSEKKKVSLITVRSQPNSYGL